MTELGWDGGMGAQTSQAPGTSPPQPPTSPIHPNHFKSLSLHSRQTAPRHRYKIAPHRKYNPRWWMKIRFMKQSKSKWLSSNDQSGRGATNPNGYAEEIRFCLGGNWEAAPYRNPFLHRGIWLSLASQGPSRVNVIGGQVNVSEWDSGNMWRWISWLTMQETGWQEIRSLAGDGWFWERIWSDQNLGPGLTKIWAEITEQRLNSNVAVATSPISSYYSSLHFCTLL